MEDSRERHTEGSENPSIADYQGRRASAIVTRRGDAFEPAARTGSGRRWWALAVLVTTAMSLTLVWIVRSSSRPSRTELVWLERDGSRSVIATFSGLAEPHDPALSPDGSQVAFSVTERDSMRIVVRDLDSGVERILEPGSRPAWTANGEEVGFITLRGGEFMARRRADGSGELTLLTPVLTGVISYDIGPWSPDGSSVFGLQSGFADLSAGNVDLPAMVMETPVSNENPSISPDGRWLVFSSFEGDEERVYVRPYPDLESGLYQISLPGEARDPQWSESGNVIYYVQHHEEGADIIAARVRADPELEVVSRELFAPLQRGRIWETDGWLYDVAPDDSRAIAMVKYYGRNE